MQGSSQRVLKLLSVAAAFGLHGVAFGQSYQVAGSVGVPLTTTDDTAAAHPITYGSAGLLVQTLQVATVPNGNYQGAGTPYLVGTFGSTTGTSAQSSSTTYTAYYYNPTVGLHFFGQYSVNSPDHYLGNGNFNTYQTPGGVSVPLYTHTVNLTGNNAAGQVIANEGIEATDTKTLSIFGRHAFRFDIPTDTYVALGLGNATPDTTIGASGASFGVNYSYTNLSAGTSTGVYSFSNSANIGATGNVSGTTSRYFAYGGAVQTSTTATLGTSTWFYNAANNTTTETGLTGPGYNYARTFTGAGAGTGTFVTNNDRGTRGGFSVGTATSYVDTGDSVAHSTGAEPWLYSAATGTASPVSLYQSGITPTVAGSVLSYAYSNPASFNNSSNTASFSGSNRSGSVAALNSVGQVGGNSTLYQAGTSTSKGQDAFVYTPGAATPYRQVGLTSNGFAANGTSSFVSTAGVRSSTLSYLNVAGQSVGTSTQYVSSGAAGAGNASNNSVAWFAPAATPAVQIGLFDTYHTATTAGYTYTSSSVNELTDSGLVGGSSGRFAPGTATSLGSDPWIYDATTGITTNLDPFANSPTAYFSGSITYLSETGLAVGQYKTNSAASFSAFAWTPTSGFIDLTTAAGLSTGTSPFQTLINGFSINPDGTIYATAGTLNNGTASQTGIAVLTVAVPEPATLSIAAVGAALLAGRRRRRR